MNEERVLLVFSEDVDRIRQEKDDYIRNIFCKISTHAKFPVFKELVVEILGKNSIEQNRDFAALLYLQTQGAIATQNSKLFTDHHYSLNRKLIEKTSMDVSDQVKLFEQVKNEISSDRIPKK